MRPLRPAAVFIQVFTFATGFLIAASLVISLRMLISYVGTSLDVRTVMTGSFLLALAAGVNFAGRILPGKAALRAILRRDFMVILIALLVGLSLLSLSFIFVSLYQVGVISVLLRAVVYALIFLVPLGFCLGRAGALLLRASPVPVHGLAVALIGTSFGVAVPLLLTMPVLGVNLTVMLLLAFTAVLLDAVSRRVTIKQRALVVLLVLAGFAMNSNVVLGLMGIVSQNAHNTVAVTTTAEGGKSLLINSYPADGYQPDKDDAGQITAKAEAFLLTPASSPRDILVLGNPGLTFGRNDTTDRLTYVQDDPAFKEVVAKTFLGAEAGDNKSFVSAPLRGYIKDAVTDGRQYDAIYVDALNGAVWLPDDLVSTDAFMALRRLLKPDGAVVVTTYASPNFANRYSLDLDAAFRSAFPVATRFPVMTDREGITPVSNGAPLLLSSYLYIGYARTASPAPRDVTNGGVWNKPPSRDR